MLNVNIIPVDALAPCITKASAGMYGPSLDETVSHPHDKDYVYRADFRFAPSQWETALLR